MTASRATASDLPSLQAEFREAMAWVCAPVSVVTAVEGNQPYGTTVSAFASLSMDPPMVVICLERSSGLLAVIRRTGRFGLNLLASTQSGLASNFARKAGAGKFASVPWEMTGDVPRIPGVAGFLACVVGNLVEGGDHLLVLGQVTVARTSADAPLTYHARAFGTHLPLEGCLS